MIEEVLEPWMFNRGVPDYKAKAAAARCERKLRQGAIPAISDLTAIRLAKDKPAQLIIAIAYGGHFSGDVLSSTASVDDEQLRAAIDELATEHLKGAY
jgi:hypothetical protein